MPLSIPDRKNIFPSKKLKKKISIKQRQRMSHTMVYLITGSFLFAATLALIFYFQFSRVEKAHAASSGDYRSVTSGNWNSVSTWETYNGSAWIAASSTPTSANG